MITSCISDNFVKLWDYDSCKLLKKVENFDFTFCLKVFTDNNNNNYLIVTNKSLQSYSLPDFKIFKKYCEFQKYERRRFSINKIKNVPFIFVLDENILKIFEFYSGNLFKTVKFSQELNLCNIIFWNSQYIFCCNDDWLWMKSGNSFIYNMTSNTISPFIQGYNFSKYEFNNTQFIFYNDEQKCIKAFKKGEPKNNKAFKKDGPKKEISDEIGKQNNNYCGIIIIIIILLLACYYFKSRK